VPPDREKVINYVDEAPRAPERKFVGMMDTAGLAMPKVKVPELPKVNLKVAAESTHPLTVKETVAVPGYEMPAQRVVRVIPAMVLPHAVQAPEAGHLKPVSITQVLEQPSELFVLPSSHCSHVSPYPSPHFARRTKPIFQFVVVEPAEKVRVHALFATALGLAQIPPMNELAEVPPESVT
jgi:hypothetical protein